MSDASPRVTAGDSLPSHLELKIFAFQVANDKASLLSKALLGLFAVVLCRMWTQPCNRQELDT